MQQLRNDPNLLILRAKKTHPLFHVKAQLLKMLLVEC